MAVVSLTTDYGLKDHYLARLKGAMLSQHPDLTIVDISHEIPCFDIVQAAFVFRNAWRSFPRGTIHLLSVSDQPGTAERLLVAQVEGHYVVAPDNGLLALIFDKLPSPIYALPMPEQSRSPVKDTFVEALNILVDQRPLDSLADPAGEIVKRFTLQPVIGPARIQGTVAFKDRYGNLITNISRSLFTQVGQERPFQLFFKRHDPISSLHTHYREAPVGEPLCLFNAGGMLEIAINMGDASRLLGLGVDDPVQIDFEDEE